MIDLKSRIRTVCIEVIIGLLLLIQNSMAADIVATSITVDIEPCISLDVIGDIVMSTVKSTWIDDGHDHLTFGFAKVKLFTNCRVTLRCLDSLILHRVGGGAQQEIQAEVALSGENFGYEGSGALDGYACLDLNAGNYDPTELLKPMVIIGVSLSKKWYSSVDLEGLYQNTLTLIVGPYAPH